jgi:hypothetical protein
MTSASALVFASFVKHFEQFGAIRLRRYDDLLGGEIEEYERQNRESANALLEMNEMARAIGEHPDSGLTADEAMDLLTNPALATPPKVALLMKYGGPGGLAAVAAVMPAQAEQQTRMLTVVLQSRGSVQNEDGDWLPLDGAWSDSDSRQLPGRIREGILAFIGREANGGKQGNAPAAKAKKTSPPAANPPASASA